MSPVSATCLGIQRPMPGKKPSGVGSYGLFLHKRPWRCGWHGYTAPYTWQKAQWRGFLWLISPQKTLALRLAWVYSALCLAKNPVAWVLMAYFSTKNPGAAAGMGIQRPMPGKKPRGVGSYGLFLHKKPWRCGCPGCTAPHALQKAQRRGYQAAYLPAIPSPLVSLCLDNICLSQMIILSFTENQSHLLVSISNSAALLAFNAMFQQELLPQIIVHSQQMNLVMRVFCI